MSLKTRKIFAYFLFAIYSVSLMWIILFKFMSPAVGMVRLGGIRSINFYPFDFDLNPQHHFWEVMLNFFAFVPFGLLLKQAFVKWWKIIVFGFVFSLFCEIMQYILAIGVSDITDLITNTSGVIFGILIFITARKLMRFYKRKRKT